MPPAFTSSRRVPTNDVIELKHEAFSRRGFAEGAVRAAEWIAGKTGVWEFSEIAAKMN